MSNKWDSNTAPDLTLEMLEKAIKDFETGPVEIDYRWVMTPSQFKAYQKLLAEYEKFKLGEE